MSFPMQQGQGREQFWIGFLNLDLEGQPHDFSAVPIQDVIDILTATQQAIFAAASRDLDFQRGQRLSVEQREALTLEIVGAQRGSLLVILTFIVTSAASGIIGNGAWSVLQRLLRLFTGVANGQDVNANLARAVLPYLVQITKISTRNNRATEFTYEAPSGEKITYRTSTSGNEQVLQAARRLEIPVNRRSSSDDSDPNTSQVFEYGTVLVMNGIEHSLIVKFPYYTEPITCVYDARIETQVARRMHVHDQIAVYGSMRHVPPTPLSPVGIYIKVEGIRDKRGNTMGSIPVLTELF